MDVSVERPGAAWRRAARNPGVWKRGAVVGGVAGALQIAVNHGDTWLRGPIDGTVLLKTALCLVVAAGVALTTALWSHAARG